MLRSLVLVVAGLMPLAGHAACPDFLDQDMRRLHSSEMVNLCSVADSRPLLIINTASHCGYTPQFKGLEALHQKYGERLAVVGFASNDFRQEASDEAKAAEICFVNNGVTFTMIAPTAVKGEAANPVFAELGKRSESPSWNFNKYLVSADGTKVQHFSSSTGPDSPVLNEAIVEMF
ncbi:MAG: glutathione peroxidase [Pseudomonadota bacterium]